MSSLANGLGKNNENLEKSLQPHKNHLDFIELRDPRRISEMKVEASKTLVEAQKEIRKLEVEFLINENKIQCKKG